MSRVDVELDGESLFPPEQVHFPSAHPCIDLRLGQVRAADEREQATFGARASAGRSPLAIQQVPQPRDASPAGCRIESPQQLRAVGESQGERLGHDGLEFFRPCVGRDVDQGPWRRGERDAEALADLMRTEGRRAVEADPAMPAAMGLGHGDIDRAGVGWVGEDAVEERG